MKIISRSITIAAAMLLATCAGTLQYQNGANAISYDGSALSASHKPDGKTVLEMAMPLPRK